MRREAKVVVWGAVSLSAVLLAAFGVLCCYFYFASPVSPVVEDGDIRQELPELADADNAYAAFLAATNLLVYSSADRDRCVAYLEYARGYTNRICRAGKDFDAAGCRQECDRVLSEHARFFDEFHRIAGLSGYRAFSEQGDVVFLPPISKMSWARQLLILKSVRSREEGDFQAALTAARDLLRFFSLCRDNASSLVELLVGAGCCSSAYFLLAENATDKDVPDEVLSEIAALTAGGADEDDIFRRAMKREYVMVSCAGLKSIDECVQKGDARQLFTDDTVKAWYTPAIAFLVPSSLLKDFAFNRAATQQVIADRFRTAMSGKRLGTERIKIGVFCPNWIGLLVRKSLQPAFDRCRTGLKGCTFRTLASRVAVAAQRYRRAHGGDYPTDLSQLVPAYMDAVPRDPFAPDRELGYDGSTLMLWTVGEEGDFSPLGSAGKKTDTYDHKQRRCFVYLDLRPR